MTAAFPDHPYLSGFYRPLRAEMDAFDLEIRGTLPEGLEGLFLRNGPDPLYPPKEGDRYHVFDGDGMVVGVRIAGGRASMRNRWVRTRKWELEREAGRRKFGVFGNPRFSDPDVSPMDYNTANTHIWPHGGRLLALMEGAPPVAMDPETLDTLGSETFGGAAAGPFTAHPKGDPQTGELHAFGYGVAGPGSTAIRYNVVDAAGQTATVAMLDQPYPSMMHDFALTERHVVFPCLPVVVSLERAMAGLPLAAWEPDRPAAFGVMAKGGPGGEAVRWIERDPTFAFHVANSFDDGGDIVIDVAGSKRAPLMPAADGTLPDHNDTRFALTRWRIAGNRVEEERLDGLDLQFPRIDDRWQGKRYSRVFANGTARPTAGRIDGFDLVAAYDLERGTRQEWCFGPHAYAGEPVFVPSGPSEGEGWLLCLVWDQAANESALHVLDAQRLDQGPLASILMPTRIPGGFHCHWMPA